MLPLIATAVGLGPANGPASSASTASVSPDEVGQASGISNIARYIGEFERLLEDVSRGDRGQVVARTYLTSETGKVYTMLAHAAGRFGNE